MISAARFAYGNARVRAMKSRLLGPDDAFLLRSAASLAALAGALDVPVPADARQLHLVLFESLVGDYEKVIASFPTGRPLFLALLGLHEIENLKLVWRARVRGLPAARWVPLWRPLGRLAALCLADWRTAESPREAASLAKGTAYEGVVAQVLRAHENDAAAAEIAFDRFAWLRLAGEGRRLRRAEHAARELVLSLVREHDTDAVRRAIVLGGATPETARQAAVLFPREILAGGVVPPPGQLDAQRRLRRKACRAAFLGPPFRLAPPFAYLLFREEEVRALTALAEACGSPAAAAAALERAFAASALAG